MTSPLTGEEVLAPIIGTVYPMEITIGGNTLGATAPRVVAVDLEMQELSEGELLGWVPDDFLTDLYVLMKIPDQPFRYSVEWTDAEGEKIRRMDGRIFVPNKGKSSVTDKDVDYFRETFSPY